MRCGPEHNNRERSLRTMVKRIIIENYAKHIRIYEERTEELREKTKEREEKEREETQEK